MHPLQQHKGKTGSGFYRTGAVVKKDLIKGQLGFLIPVKMCVFPGKLSDWGDDGREPLNESAVKVGKAHKSLNVGW